MSLGKFLDQPSLKNVRDVAATIRAVTFLGSPVLAVALVAYLAWGKRLIASDVTIVILIASTVIAALTGSWIISIRNSRTTNAYVVRRFETVLCISRLGDHHAYRYTSEQLIKARRSGVRLIDAMWYWTGQASKPCELVSLIGDHLVFDGKYPDENRVTYSWIYLGRGLMKNEEVTVKFERRFEDDLQPMRPYFTHSGNGYKLDLVRIVLRFPLDEEPAKVEGREVSGKLKASAIAPLPVVRSMNLKEQVVDFELTVNHPSRNRRYGLRWEW